MAETYGDIESDIADQYHTLQELEDIPPRPLSRMRFYEDSEPSGLEIYEDSSSDDDDSVDSVSELFSDDSDVDLSELPKFATSMALDNPPLAPAPFIDEFESLPKISYVRSPFISRHNPEPLLPKRHRYAHRGYSRSGLLHVKWFWANREEEWADYDAYRDCSPYGGIVNPATRPGPTLEREIIPALSSTPPPLTIHPRRGDIPALRDPLCEHMDRYFVNMPMWTISKALWMYDVHVGIQTRDKAEASIPLVSSSDDESDSSELDLSVSVLTEFSDDSDVTLVESDSDNESVADDNQSRAVPIKDSLDDDFEEVSLASPSSPTCKTVQIRNAHQLSRQPKTSSPSWNTSWYRRLEVLLRLAGSERVRHNSLGAIPRSIVVQ